MVPLFVLIPQSADRPNVPTATTEWNTRRTNTDVRPASANRLVSVALSVNLAVSVSLSAKLTINVCLLANFTVSVCLQVLRRGSIC